MTTVPEPDNSVDDFLKTISLLGEKRNKEDDERARKLEAEILQGRRERQARRAEHARSIASSPRDSPSNIHPSHGDHSPVNGRTGATATRETAWSPASPAGEMEHLESGGGNQQTKKAYISHSGSQHSPEKPSIPSTLPSPSNTLSWQRRPTSRDSSSPQRRPISNAFPDAQAPVPPNHDGDALLEKPSRDQIKQSLSSKDPSWFRQTAERGIGSVAYRKSTESSESFGMDGTMRLPGLGRDLLSEPNLSNPEASRDISTSLSRTNSARTTNSWDNRISHISSASVGGTAQSSTLPVSSPQDLQPSQEEIDSITEQRSPSRITMSPAQGRMSAERPGSPTKGLGGFVQSAMLKRSDSVNKRWKIDAPPGLTRADSIASSRSAASTAKMPRSPQRESRFVDLDQHSLPSPSSRPNSSHEQDITAQGMNVDRDTKGDDRNMIGEESTAVSSSKTMDSKRWSPTKASWLESALSRPDSPTKNLSSPHQHQSGRSASKLEARDSNSIGAEGQRDDTRETSDAKLLAYEIHDTDQVVREYHGEIDASLALPRASSAKNKTSSLISETPSDLVGQLEKKDEVGPDIEAPLRRTLPQQTQRPLGSRFEERNATASLAGSKPDTPPKPNFRANLKPKDVSDSKSSNGELEFRNVFGKLKRTETKNYVAPDELKNNILRGKAGLNVTGGPRKTQRVDEFKESILKQKAAMKEGGGSMIKRTPDSTAATTGKPSPNLPEAFSKRQQMSRSSSAQSDQAVKDVSVDKFSLGKEASLSSVSQPGNKVQETGSIDTRKPSMTKRFSDPSRKNETKPSGSVKVSDSETLTVPNRRLVNYQDSARSEPRLTSSSAHSQTSKPGDTSKAGSLAERLNPALAGLISRRPGQPASLTNMIAQSEESVMPGNNQVEHVVDATQGPSLTHTTKGRARGPKRRLPNAGKWSKAATLDGKDEKEALDNSIGEPESSPTQSKPNTTQFCPPSTSAALIKESSGAREASGTESRNTVSTPNMPEPKLPPSSPRESAHRVKSKPVVAPKSPVLRKVSSPKRSQYLGSDEVINARVERAIGLKVSEDPTKKTGAPRASKSQPSPGPPHPNSPSEASLPSSGRTKERGSSSPKSEALEQPDTKVRDWKAETKAIQQLLTKLFAQVPSLNITGSFDADKILHSQATQGQSTAQTILSQVSQLDPSGKATPLPAYKEHILFEDGIYICVYVYHPPHQPLEKHSEVFLWVGDQVPEAASEDAQLFGRKTAREYSTKLQVLRQGKESPNFLQAIAGVLLVRRSRSDEQYMLSARAHMKHLAFDEVEFDAQNLCSGFPYLIKSKTGKQYLWKGRGSTADELGIARLIGMDLGLTGEPSEIDEGTEPEQFFASFPTTHRRNDPDSWTAHWALKPKVPRYCTYLYRVSVDPGRPTSNLSSLWGRRGSSPPKNRTFTTNIVEIHPFAQCDLEPGQIYILDAYFEIFVLITPQSFTRHVEFATALLFAQEYAILATSMQDRPTMPAGTIVLPMIASSSELQASDGGEGETTGELPRGIREAFRKWDRKLGIASEVKRWKVLKLESVLEACEGGAEQTN